MPSPESEKSLVELLDMALGTLPSRRRPVLTWVALVGAFNGGSQAIPEDAETVRNAVESSRLRKHFGNGSEPLR